MKEDALERSSKYIATTMESLKALNTKELPAAISKNDVDRILKIIRGYIRDAQHYADNRKPVTSLASVAYAEGLLDALKFLDLIDI